YRGTALGIAFTFDDTTLKANVNKSLKRLREHCYINFRKGNGLRGGYDVLIHKYEITLGELKGKRLDAWKHGDLCIAEYETWNAEETVEQQSSNGGVTVEEQSS